MAESELKRVVIEIFDSHGAEISAFYIPETFKLWDEICREHPNKLTRFYAGKKCLLSSKEAKGRTQLNLFPRGKPETYNGINIE
ncbi:MAG: hypothetical protein ACFB0G_14510 [Leptolyngbyaceae cyanobacterium]